MPLRRRRRARGVLKILKSPSGQRGMCRRQSNRGILLLSYFGVPAALGPQKLKTRRLASRKGHLGNWPSRGERTTLFLGLPAECYWGSLAVGQPFGEVPVNNFSFGMVSVKTGNETESVHLLDRKLLNKL